MIGWNLRHNLSHMSVILELQERQLPLFLLVSSSELKIEKLDCLTDLENLVRQEALCDVFVHEFRLNQILGEISLLFF